MNWTPGKIAMVSVIGVLVIALVVFLKTGITFG